MEISSFACAWPAQAHSLCLLAYTSMSMTADLIVTFPAVYCHNMAIGPLNEVRTGGRGCTYFYNIRKLDLWAGGEKFNEVNQFDSLEGNP